MKLLSIIVPFYNSERKCTQLLKTLAASKAHDVEIICIDDGSQDGTLEILKKFSKESSIQVKVITQENKGPGGARNSGLDYSQGKYVWFVDSDDDIKFQPALEVLRKNSHRNFDFVDFNYESKSGLISSMNVAPGEYYDKDAREILLNNMGRIWTKIIRADAIKNINYPEYCIYEDNPFIFIFPFVFNGFLKTETTAYIYNEEPSSITRSTPGPKSVDRLYTALWGFKAGASLATNAAELDILKKKFQDLFLINSVYMFIKRDPLMACRIVKLYRHISGESNLPPQLAEKKLIIRVIFRSLWFFSNLLSDQKLYFENQRLLGWSKPFPYGDFSSLSS